MTAGAGRAVRRRSLLDAPGRLVISALEYGKVFFADALQGVAEDLPTAILLVIAAVIGLFGLSYLSSSFSPYKILAVCITFFVPLIFGGLGGLRILARLQRASRIAKQKESIIKDRNAQRLPPTADFLKRFETDRDNTPQDYHPDRVIVVSAGVASRVSLQCSQMRYDPVASVLATDMQEIRSGTSVVRNAQVLAVRLGILFTFVGLTLGLYHVLPILQDAGASKIQTQTAIRDLVTQLAMAFSTSIAGLFAAILLQIEAGTISRRESELLKALESMILTLQLYHFNSIRTEPIIKSMDALSSTVSSFHGRLEEARIGFDRTAADVVRNLEVQDERLKERVGAVEELRDDFSKLVRTQGQALQQLEGVLRTGSERVIAEFAHWFDRESAASSTRAAAEGLKSVIAQGHHLAEQHAMAIGKSLRSVGEVHSTELRQIRAAMISLKRTLFWLSIAIFIAMLTLLVTVGISFAPKLPDIAIRLQTLSGR